MSCVCRRSCQAIPRLPPSDPPLLQPGIEKVVPPKKRGDRWEDRDVLEREFGPQHTPNTKHSNKQKTRNPHRRSSMNIIVLTHVVCHITIVSRRYHSLTTDEFFFSVPPCLRGEKRFQILRKTPRLYRTAITSQHRKT